MAFALQLALAATVTVSALAVDARAVRAEPSTLPLPSAGDAAEGGAEKDRLIRARRLFREGLAAARADDWEAARATFEEVYALAPSPQVLFNLAGAQRRTARLLASHANYRRVSQREDGGVTPELRRLAERLAEEVALVIPRLRLAIDGLSAQDRVVLDRQRMYIDELGRELWLDPGAHTIHVDRASGDAEVRTLTLAEREVRVLSMRLP